jgi:hypothetical protein
MNCQENCEATIKSIFDFCELKFPLDFLRHLNLSFDPRIMEREDFESRLFDGSANKSLSPLRLDLPEVSGCIDFSRDYLRDQAYADNLRAFDFLTISEEAEGLREFQGAWKAVRRGSL